MTTWVVYSHVFKGLIAYYLAPGSWNEQDFTRDYRLARRYEEAKARRTAGMLTSLGAEPLDLMGLFLIHPEFLPQPEKEENHHAP